MFYESGGKVFLFAGHRFQNYGDEADVTVAPEGHEMQLESSLWNHQKDDLTTEVDHLNERVMDLPFKEVHRKGVDLTVAKKKN